VSAARISAEMRETATIVSAEDVGDLKIFVKYVILDTFYSGWNLPGVR
jgi:hypothetical protein